VSLCWTAAGRSHRGLVRRRNEDAFATDLRSGIFVVADGMGGHAAGQVASSLAVEHALAALREHREREGVLGSAHLVASFQAARDALAAHVGARPADRGLGTTLTVLTLRPDGAFLVGHIGDSRLYRFRGGASERLTKDHTLVMREVAAGRLPESALQGHPLSHILARVLQEDDADEPDLIAGSAEPDDLYLLCSDGLHGVLTDTELALSVGGRGPLEDLLEGLIETALAAGAPDNVTAVAVRILPGRG
jgi:serine/threonine protein phosphatase PrpC